MQRKSAKDILSESFREPVERMSVDKITVKDITENCGYSPATFCRRFRDKYDLIAWQHTRDVRSCAASAATAARGSKRCLTARAAFGRIACELVEADDRAVRVAMLDKMPSLKAMYDPNDGNMLMLRVQNATATFSSFTAPSETVSL